MLLGRADQMFASADWIYEPKWDGFRTLASVRRAAVVGGMERDWWTDE
jgi:hypothetical protein